MLKRVVHFKPGAFLPLTENWIHAQIRGLQRWEPVVYCSTRQNADAFPVARLRSFDWDHCRPASLFNRACARVGIVPPALAAAMQEDRSRIIHAHFGPSSWDALGLKRRYSVPLVTTSYGYDLSQLPQQEPVWRKRYRRLFAGGDIFLVEGGHMRQCLIALGCPHEKAAVQHMGVDLAAIPYQPRRPDPSGEIRVLAAATFTEKKGLPYVVEAVGLAQRAHPGWKLRLSIIGDARDNPGEAAEKRRILAAIERSGIADRVELLGFRSRDHLHRAFYEHHLFISPSVTAGDGNTEGGAPVGIIEASASGMPVIATTHCDIPEVVREGESGCLAPKRDAAALAEKLAWLVEEPFRWAEFGRAGRRHIEAEYDSARLGLRLEQMDDGIA